MLTFLDFDGVIIDSIEECYTVSLETYYGFARFPYEKNEYRKLFYKYRGLVRPACEYMVLHRAIESFLHERNGSVDIIFRKMLESGSKKEKESFEKFFFYRRKQHKDNNIDSWVAMNPLTAFGKKMIGKEHPNTYIVTTKNMEATEVLLDYYNINVAGIYASDDIKRVGSKGSLITQLLNDKNEDRCVFVDDAVEHLDTVEDNRIKCYFADWGYGKNTANYPKYTKNVGR